MATALVNLCGHDLHMYGVGRIHPSAPAATVDASSTSSRSMPRRNWYPDICPGPVAGGSWPLRVETQNHIDRYVRGVTDDLAVEAAACARPVAQVSFAQERPRWTYWADPAAAPARHADLVTIAVDDGYDTGVVAVSRRPLGVRELAELSLTPCSPDALGQLVLEAAARVGRPVVLIASPDDGSARRAMLHRDPRPDRSGPYRMTIIDRQGPIGHFGPHAGESTQAFLAGYIGRGYHRLDLGTD